MKAIYTIILLVFSNVFMNFAWYGHLKFKDYSWGKNLALPAVILVSWGMALFEYMLLVPANRIGFIDNGGPFTLVQLKTMQEVITLIVFMAFSFFVFGQKLQWNHVAGFVLLVLAVALIFRKF
jgi:uncharacterized protein (DUF486 family)